MMSAEPDWGDDDDSGGEGESPERIRGIGREKRTEAEGSTRKTSKVERSSPDASVMHSRKLVSRPSQIGGIKDSYADASPTNEHVPRPESHEAQSHNPGELHRAATAHKGPNNRRQEFIDFYIQHDPSRAPDLGAHVDFLLANYRFEDIVESLEQKYGTVPQGWSQTAHEEEYEQVSDTVLRQLSTTCSVKFECADQCSACLVEFSFFNRRHHCRHCGRSFCGKHSRKITTYTYLATTAIKPNMAQQEKLVRLCDECVRGSRESVRIRANGEEDYKIDLSDEAKALLAKMIASDKKVDFLDALQVFSNMLDSITLPESSVAFKQACKDVLREHVVLNGVSFVGEGEAKVARLIAAVKNTMLSTANMSIEQAEAATQRILCGTSRTSSGADSYFMLHLLFDRPNLLLKPRPGPLHPIQIELWGSGSRLTCTVCTTNLFGLYIRNQIEGAASLPDAWVLLDTVVTENLHFDVLSPNLVMPGKRVLSISSPEYSPAPSKEAEELF